MLSSMLSTLTSLLVVLIPLVWLAVAALVVTACRMAARGDGRELAVDSRR